MFDRDRDRPSVPDAEEQLLFPPPPGYDYEVSQHHPQPGFPEHGYESPPTPDFNYSVYDIPYRQMSIDDWQSVPNDPSPYGQMWSSPQSFEPETFSQNVIVEKQWNDVLWTVLFLINFIVTIVLFSSIGATWRKQFLLDLARPAEATFLNELNTTSSTEVTITSAEIVRVLGISSGIGIFSNIIHYSYAMFYSYYYIKFGVWIGCAISFLFIFLPLLTGEVGTIVFPCLMLIVSILMYFAMRKYFKLSAAILSITSHVILENFAIVGLIVFQGLLTLIISIVFGLEVFFVAYLNISPFLYLYMLFSYVWIITTFGYVIYMTCSGVGATWYFLTGTDYYPKSPVWESFKRATTTSFGSAALTAFIIAVITVLRKLVQSKPKKENQATELLRCCALCILSVLEDLFGFVNRYALIYCATFGVPFKEGCRRWAELSVHRFVNLIMNGSVIGMALAYNGLVFIIGTGLLGFGIGALMDGSGVMMCITTILAMIAVFAILIQPITAVSDTLLVCFSEAPERLRSSAGELYDYLVEHYGQAVAEKMANGT